jgi:hypothetical protein
MLDFSDGLAHLPALIGGLLPIVRPRQLVPLRPLAGVGLISSLDGEMRFQAAFAPVGVVPGVSAQLLPLQWTRPGRSSLEVGGVDKRSRPWGVPPGHL